MIEVKVTDADTVQALQTQIIILTQNLTKLIAENIAIRRVLMEGAKADALESGSQDQKGIPDQKGWENGRVQQDEGKGAGVSPGKVH